jgi:hypothetical protein
VFSIVVRTLRVRKTAHGVCRLLSLRLLLIRRYLPGMASTLGAVWLDLAGGCLTRAARRCSRCRPTSNRLAVRARRRGRTPRMRGSRRTHGPWWRRQSAWFRPASARKNGPAPRRGRAVWASETGTRSSPSCRPTWDRRRNNCRTQGESPIFVERKLGQPPHYSFAARLRRRPG